MTAAPDTLSQKLSLELALLWSAHHTAGLEGYMCLYSCESQVPFRTKQPGIRFWFGPEDIAAAVEQILYHYNNGELPNTPLLLNPIVHTKTATGEYKPLGSGIAWSTSLCLGVDALKDESTERLWELGVQASPFHRGENTRAGIKIITICQEPQSATVDGKTVTGCQELYDIADIHSPSYAPFYLLSGISYLTNNGSFYHPDIAALFPKNALNDGTSGDKVVRAGAMNIQKILDAAHCWNAYDRHHSLYKKFGINPDDVPTNLNFFNLVARDVELFDATGPMRKDADEMFEFLVPGLIPRGSVTLLAGPGGCGKSSLAHQLCVMAAIDYDPGEEAPHWLGQRLAIEKCQGICVYFSGEDGPPIINARAAIFDSKGRATRLMFQRTDFGGHQSFSEHLRHLQKIPNVPLMIIDPASKYLTGDENDTTAVSQFFEGLEEFAVKKGTAIIVVHHLQKGAYPKNTRESIDMLRGSQLFVDRPRVIIGMCRDGSYTIVGLAKNNIPPNLGMVTEERVFARDPKKLQLVWLPGKEGIRNAELSPEEIKKLEEEALKQKR